MRAAISWVAPLFATIVAAGCAVPFVDVEGALDAPMADRIFVRNATSGPLVVRINGQMAGAVNAGVDGAVSFAGLAGPPYRIEVRTPGGTVAFEYEITIDEFRQTSEGSSSSGGGTATPCGWVEVSYGSARFSDPDPMAALPTPGGFCP